jgi:hypothetical protein
MPSSDGGRTVLENGWMPDEWLIDHSKELALIFPVTKFNDALDFALR